MSNRVNTDIGLIPSDWKAVKFSDYAELKHGYQFRTYDFTDEGIKVFKITQIKANGETDISNCDFIDCKRLNDFSNFIINKGDILVALTGATIGKISRFWENETVLQNYRVGSFFTKNNELLSKEFLFQFLRSNYFFNQIIARQTQSAQQNIGKEEINNMTLFLPKIDEQKSIASILNAFDNKIELLKAQNKTLEETAQTIFKEWFGKYSVDDELPDGWRVGKLSEISNLKSGFAFKAEDFIEESNFKAIKIKDLKGNGNISLSDISAITEKITKSERVQYFKLDEGDILLAMSGNTTGKIGVLPSSENEIYLNQRVGKFFMKDKKYNSFLYNFLMSGSFEEKILGMGYGSAQPNINPSQIENIVIIYPDETKMNDYLNISNPIFEKVLKNNTQIQTLTKTRDELLPRLMSGEIRVNEYKK